MRLYTETGLAEPIIKAVVEKGYEHMTPIQEAAIPVVLAGQDIMGAAQTGTGKTAAFILPLLQRMLVHQNLSASPARHPVRALVLLPTRELADQVSASTSEYAKYTQLRSTVVFGGMDMKPQAAALKGGVEILVATPGRLLDHLEAKNCTLRQVEYVVLDEADRMLDIGFLPDLQRILNYLPKKRVTLLFSATFSSEIKRLAESYLNKPTLIEVARPNATAATVEQLFYQVGADEKRQAVVQLVREKGIGQAFVFCNSKLACARLARALERDGFATTALHGDKSQDERLKALDAFKQGQVQLLVATDVAARGLDIKGVPAVFNYDLPFSAEDYVHRIGRTGRAGALGLALSLAADSDKRLLSGIEKLIKKRVEVLPLPQIEGKDSAFTTALRKDRIRRSKMDKVGMATSTRDAAWRPSQPQQAGLDPFFTQVYEEKPAQADARPSWETNARTNNSKTSSNIKSKRKIPALFKATQT